MAETVLGNVLEFFGRLGVYDVILPFILVFTIVFAILERTRILGTEDNQTKKNLNAMVAFVIGFLVIASSQLVGTITQVSSQVVILLMLSVFFLLLVGTFQVETDLKGGVKLAKGWQILFSFIMFLGIVFIFLEAIKNEAGKSWLQVFIDWLGRFATDTAVASILLLIVVIGIVVFITYKKS